MTEDQVRTEEVIHKYLVTNIRKLRERKAPALEILHANAWEREALETSRQCALCYLSCHSPSCLHASCKRPLASMAIIRQTFNAVIIWMLSTALMW